MKTNTPPQGLPIPERIRNRRDALGIAGYEVARRAGISGSYLSLIESGAKLPSEEIAVRIAAALDDDPEIYRAWVHASPYPDLGAHVERLQRYASVSTDPELRSRLRRGERIEAEEGGEATRAKGDLLRASARRAWHAARTTMGWPPEDTHVLFSCESPIEPERPATIEIPLLADGADPGADARSSAEVLETVHLDSRVLPPGIEQPFAYRPGPAAVERVRGAIHAGDVVVLTARPSSVDPAGVYAVRHKGKVVLSRVLRSGTTLLLLPGDDAGSPEIIEARDERALLALIAGAVVTTIRSWRRTAEDGAALRAAPRGRSVRLEGDYLVRDCQWKDPYGWRPLQRPEDLDYLEQHPGTKIRFRLIREGRLRYLLEMSPDEWRGALGSYAEGPNWRSNGYIVAITRRVAGGYTEEFQERWSGFVSEVGGGGIVKSCV